MKVNQRHYLRRIGLRGKSRIVFSILWGLFFFCFILPNVLCSDVWAADSGRRKGTPRIDVDDPIYKNYPTRYDGMGYIDVIAPDRILIDDTPYPLAASVTFHTPKRRRAPANWFQKGQYVGYLKDSNGAIKDVYLLKIE
jgi:hypothetical protein